MVTPYITKGGLECSLITFLQEGVSWGPLPSRLQGFRLKRALSRLCASMLRNCGIPSFALQDRMDGR